MKRFMLIIVFVIFFICLPKRSTAGMNIQTGFHLDWWKSVASQHGRLTYLPITIANQYNQFSYKLLSGLAITDYNYKDKNKKYRRDLTSALDTKVNLSYEILGLFPLDAIIGLDLNLPTGRRQLKDEDMAILTNFDLFSIKIPGEGFNINPTLTVGKEWEKWSAGIGLGYDRRGKYNYSTEIIDYDPGDIFNLVAKVKYKFSPNWQGSILNSYAYFSKDTYCKKKDTLQKRYNYQEGDFYLVGVSLAYIQSSYDTSITISNILRGKSKFPEDTNGVFAQTRNNYGDEWVGDLSGKFFINDQTIIKSFLQYYYVDENDFSHDQEFYVGKKDKFSFGVGLSNIFTNKVMAEFSFKGFILDYDTPKLYFDSTHFHGYYLDIRLSKNY